MTLRVPYRFAVAMFAADGADLGAYAAQRDWEPVCEWTRLKFQRTGELPLDGNGRTSVVPVWDRSLGEPYCRGYRVEIERQGRPPVSAEFPKAHFKEFASSLASRFIEEKKLREGDRYSYAVVALPVPPEAAQANGIQVTDCSPRVPAKDASLGDYLSRSTPHGVTEQSDVSVFVSPRVLEEAAELTRTHRGIETGGILIGSIWQDTRVAEMFVEITAQIPAEYTAGTSVKLSFTPQTWAAADAALRLRGRGEVPLGFFHSHPVFQWCRSKECTLEAQKICRLAKDFFSADDEAVMRAAFPRAYSVALVANDTAFDLTFSMFGNREGIITTPRGFFILKES